MQGRCRSCTVYSNHRQRLSKYVTPPCDRVAAHSQLRDNRVALEIAESYVMNKVPAIACLTVRMNFHSNTHTISDPFLDQQLLWQFGDTHYHAKRWKPAADWFLLGTRKAFQVVASTTHSKCLRKAALCYIQAGELARLVELLFTPHLIVVDRATTITQKASNDEAATHYLRFMSSIYQGAL